MPKKLDGVQQSNGAEWNFTMRDLSMELQHFVDG